MGRHHQKLATRNSSGLVFQLKNLGLNIEFMNGPKSAKIKSGPTVENAKFDQIQPDKNNRRLEWQPQE